MKRFYTHAAIDVVGHGLFAVRLDGKPVRTPNGNEPKLPRHVAEALAAEWNAQGEDFEPAAMVLVKCINTAVDHVVGNEKIVVDGLLQFVSDVLCYRSDKPDLAAEQAAGWDPLLAWAAEHLGARLKTGTGPIPIVQNAAALDALRTAAERFDAFALTALHGAATILGSLVLALAVAEGRLTAEEAFALSQIDEAYQMKRWGYDEEAVQRARRLEAELKAVAQVLLRPAAA